jgi:hypothetical protein
MLYHPGSIVAVETENDWSRVRCASNWSHSWRQVLVHTVAAQCNHLYYYADTNDDCCYI